MKITNISVQARNNNRVNVSVDGKYKFSLDVFQVGELGLKVGKEFTEQEIKNLEEESQFGKLYSRTLEYCMIRPRSIREVRDYLWRKTRSSKTKSMKTGKVIERKAISQDLADRVLNRLIEKRYLDDKKFADFWVENRFLTKGISLRRLKLELVKKGVDRTVIEDAILKTSRDEKSELAKVFAKKKDKYQDKNKLIQYLVRQGFSYGDVVSLVDDSEL